MEFKNCNTLDLLKYYEEILEVLRIREVIRNANPPAGGYAEHIVSNALKLTLENNSNAGYDAKDAEGNRYEIKARRITSHNNSRQLSAIRNLENKHFDYLVGVIFSSNFDIFKACIIPHDLVVSKARFSHHTNSNILILADTLWLCDGVKDITETLRNAQKTYL